MPFRKIHYINLYIKKKTHHSKIYISNINHYENIQRRKDSIRRYTNTNIIIQIIRINITKNYTINPAEKPHNTDYLKLLYYFRQ
jgi:hypothetical protein